ncbi:hypothetical protein K8R62_02360 [bacterium]|nr:hypothetical protein [bacterium]
MTLLYILLAIIAFILWQIYRQKEEQKEQIANEKFEAEWEQKKKEELKDYPHLIGNIDYTWLELFGKLHVEKGFPHLKATWLIYLKESNNTKLNIVEVDLLFDLLWDLSEELLEHLEKYHESFKYEYEIAILTYWQIVAEKADTLIGKDLETIKKIFQSPPFTDIQKIASWFPKKVNHPAKEISFTDKKGLFPRESKGSALIQKKLKALGL